MVSTAPISILSSTPEENNMDFWLTGCEGGGGGGGGGGGLNIIFCLCGDGGELLTGVAMCSQVQPCAHRCSHVLILVV